jgi:hypothetical protein
MKKSITAALLSIVAFNIYAQDTQRKVVEKPLVIHSSQGRVEIRNPSTCTQHRNVNGAIAITCDNQCKQTTDSRDGRILIQC